MSFDRLYGSDGHQAKPDFQSLFEAVPGQYLVLLPNAPTFTIVAVSDAYADATMTRRDEIVGRGLFEIFTDNSSDPTGAGATRLRASLERVLTRRLPDPEANKKYEIGEQAGFGGEAEKRWWRSTNSPVIGPDGEVEYIIHAIDDVTELHRLEAERQQFAALFTLANDLFDQACDSIFIGDRLGRLTDVNASACRMLGYRREELIGKNIRDFVSPDDVPRLADMREYLFSSGMVQVAEWTNVKKDGTRISVEASAKILPDGRWQAIVRDISERKRAERTVQESEERFRLIIDEAPIGMALVALDGRFVRVNRALCEIVGYTATELTALSFQTITHPEDRERDLSAAGQLVRGEISRYQREKRYVTKSGT